MMKQWGGTASESVATLWTLCAALAFAIAPIVGSASSSNHQFRGISPQDVMYYKSSDVIKCRDGSNKFTKAQLNDNYCDCPDGTDEPGTSACPNGKFYCPNAGHVPLLLFSSRVNDGICDCCDGSDEYDNKVKCPNTCWEAGKVARDKLKKKIATLEEGFKIRKVEVEHAKVAITKDEAELLKLQNEEKVLKGLVEQLQERKEQIEKLEEEERLWKEKEEKKHLEREKDETKKIESTETADVGESKTEEKDNSVKDEATENGAEEYKGEGIGDDRSGNWEDSATNEGRVEEAVDSEFEAQLPNKPETGASMPKDIEEDTELEKDKPLAKSETGESVGFRESSEEVLKKNDANSELSREELGRLVASRWTGENTEEQSGSAESTNDSDEENHDILKDTHDNDGYASDTDGEHQKYDDDNQRYDDDLEDDLYDIRDENHDESTSSERYYSDSELDSPDMETKSTPTWLEKIQRTVRNVLKAVHIFQPPVNQSDAANIRKEYEESNARLSKIQSRISSLSQKLQNDFGPEKEFYSFYDQCFESKKNKYTYKICPYKQASQVEGHSTTRLGRWSKFEDSYGVMIFSSGDHCWNGPDRSLKVKLRCGLKYDITDVDEPSRCEYTALLSTPAACVEEKLQELKNKLEMLNKEEPEKHDEL
ncbi:glucosidase 2 subunit beta isoform X3 [Cucurbita pepo subsp. pepo]|uniref:glucosidase 2 subunit beta isoform X1 n=1 Tax=Cucurbita pepo subsp. pepo TaxID=3664 RepID=UPI000C9D7818|nr:glucosidase 2 subunit beta isoform X1 [Cucurbita pepo subsp. pepo]XP_023533401.1 glucosidase 2 subunit beta isoform X2 [Cucurbita pepo subsp. pepo]XP_023533403.1 glucosidase 2 subunit beta isoform X3 [Cucurbita pepo subsp. pepo]